MTMLLCASTSFLTDLLLIISILFFILGAVMIFKGPEEEFSPQRSKQNREMRERIEKRKISEEEWEKGKKRRIVKWILGGLACIAVGGFCLFVHFDSAWLDEYKTRDMSKCTICGKPSTHTFQESPYCDKHYEDAVKWVFEQHADD